MQHWVDRLAAIPANWVCDLAELDGTFFVSPMWGTLFVIPEESEVRAIVALAQQSRTLHSANDIADDHTRLLFAGWQEIGETGVLTISFRDEQLLGIHGGGYDFYSAHWEPLYDVLGYRWHLSRTES